MASPVATVARAEGGGSSPSHETSSLSNSHSVMINELSNGNSDGDELGFIEVRNWSKSPVDLTGWNLYRCSEQGLRSNYSRPEADFGGRILAPGEIFTVSSIGMPGDAHVTQPYALGGFGAILEGPGGLVADAVGVYPNEPWPTEGECTRGRNLPNVLSFAANESWQRVAVTGDTATDFIAAPSTLGASNASSPSVPARPSDRHVVVSEFSPSGPASVADEFVELENLGTTAVDMSGWMLYRCTASGRLRPDTKQLDIASGTILQPGQRWVAAARGFTGRAHSLYETPFADTASGVVVVNAEGRLVDKLAMSPYADSACQNTHSKLPAVLDYVAGESFQRSAEGYIVAPRTPGAPNALVESSVLAQGSDYTDSPAVTISEVATDPNEQQLPVGAERRNFIEIANYSDTTADIGGWTIRRCEATGIRSRTPQHRVPEGTQLSSGETYLVALQGTALAHRADARYDTALNFLGTGVWLENSAGERVDSVGIFHVNEMDASNATLSPCSNGLALETYLPDRLTGETFQRSRFTGNDVDDFVVRQATPGTVDVVEAPTLAELVSRNSAAHAARNPSVTAQLAATEEEPPATRLPGDDNRALVVEAFSGVSEGGPLNEERGSRESRIDEAVEANSFARVDDSSWGYPYHRFVLDAGTLTPGDTLTWAGSTFGRNDVALSVWDPSASAWRVIDVEAPSRAGEQVVLRGILAAQDFDRGRLTVLVQDSQRTEPSVSSATNGQLENPEDFDFAVSHITDTQYLSESYPQVYAEAAGWIIDNAAERKIAFATHTGDLIQNWVDPNQSESRARIEFDRASQIQSMLDEAGVPNSVLPGNHDNKRGQDNDLFNEYFPPSRYEGTSWYAGSLAPGDNTANYSVFEHSGATFLMLSLPYAYGEREIEWALDVVSRNPDKNVIVSTHEHVTPKTEFEQARRSESSRWLSQGRELWERVIAPNRNVIAVLSGHFHGLGQIVTENAGGIEGHTVVELLADYQEFRTHEGDRATGFQRLLQFDLDGGAIAVDTFSATLGSSTSIEYDYPQFVPENGSSLALANGRPWRIVEAGVQERYTLADDEFLATVSFQYAKAVETTGLWISSPAHAPQSDTRAMAR